MLIWSSRWDSWGAYIRVIDRIIQGKGSYKMFIETVKHFSLMSNFICAHKNFSTVFVSHKDLIFFQNFSWFFWFSDVCIKKLIVNLISKSTFVSQQISLMGQMCKWWSEPWIVSVFCPVKDVSLCSYTWRRFFSPIKVIQVVQKNCSEKCILSRLITMRSV